MLLAEALDERKKLRSKLHELSSFSMVRDEDEDEAVKQAEAAAAIEEAEVLLTRVQELTVAINARNNEALIEFNDEKMTLMQAIALRDRLVAEHKLHAGWLDAIDSAITTSKRFYERRKKDDVKQLAIIDQRALRATRDVTAETIARLDNVVQKANWTVEL